MLRALRRYTFERGPEIAVFVVLFTLLAAVLAPHVVYMIPPGHAGVFWKRFGGTVLGRTVDEGIAFTLPWNKIYIYDLRLQLVDSDFNVLTTDGLTIAVNIAYRFRLLRDQLPLLHKTVGENYKDLLLTSAIGARARDIFGKNTPEEIYSYRRVEVQKEILREMQEILKDSATASIAEGGPFVQLEDVFIRSIKLPPTVEEAINRKNQMQQRNLEYDYRLLLESKESERKRIEARGIKEFQDIVSQGITESYLRWRGIDATRALASSPNSKTVIIGSGKDGLPIILGNADGGASGAPAAPPATILPTPILPTPMLPAPVLPAPPAAEAPPPLPSPEGTPPLPAPDAP